MRRRWAPLVAFLQGLRQLDLPKLLPTLTSDVPRRPGELAALRCNAPATRLATSD